MNYKTIFQALHFGYATANILIAIYFVTFLKDIEAPWTIWTFLILFFGLTWDNLLRTIAPSVLNNEIDANGNTLKIVKLCTLISFGLHGILLPFYFIPMFDLFIKLVDGNGGLAIWIFVRVVLYIAAFSSMILGIVDYFYISKIHKVLILVENYEIKTISHGEKISFIPIITIVIQLILFSALGVVAGVVKHNWTSFGFFVATFIGYGAFPPSKGPNEFYNFAKYVSANFMEVLYAFALTLLIKVAFG